MVFAKILSSPVSIPIRRDGIVSPDSGCDLSSSSQSSSPGSGPSFPKQPTLQETQQRLFSWLADNRSSDAEDVWD